MSPEEDALIRVVAALEAEGVPYMITGSIASSYHGRPRSTHDADIVIDPDSAQLTRVVRRLATAGFHADETRALDALRRRRQFNVIEIESASKIDLIVRKDRAFSGEELRRREMVDLSPGLRVALASAEDTILSKLEWSLTAGGSQKQLDDATGVLDVNPKLDREYIERWAGELGVLDLWAGIAGSSRPKL